MSERSGKVQTVLGLIDPSDLGFTLLHEHIFSDFNIPGVPPELSMQELRQMICSQDDFTMKGLRQIICEEMPADIPDIRSLPLTLENLGLIRRYLSLHPDNTILANEDEAIEEIRTYKAAGGGSIVELSVSDFKRNPEGLKRVSQATGIHIVMGSGHYVSAWHPPELANRSEDQIYQSIVDELIEGVGDTAIKSGIIGEIGLEHPMHDDEAKVLRASARAQIDTGAALNIHPGRHEAAPLDAIRVVKEAGGDLERTVISHIENRLFNIGDMLTLAETGCYLEFDLFGYESSFWPHDPIDMPNDAVRIDYIIQMINAGYRDKLLISHDIAVKTRLTKYGGDGYSHILRNVLPVMKRKGMSNNDIEAITVRNPSRILTFR